MALLSRKIGWLIMSQLFMSLVAEEQLTVEETGVGQ
jgi:hypothetical protein